MMIKMMKWRAWLKTTFVFLAAISAFANRSALLAGPANLTRIPAGRDIVLHRKGDTFSLYRYLMGYVSPIHAIVVGTDGPLHGKFGLIEDILTYTAVKKGESKTIFLAILSPESKVLGTDPNLMEVHSLDFSVSKAFIVEKPRKDNEPFEIRLPYSFESLSKLQSIPGDRAYRATLLPWTFPWASYDPEKDRREQNPFEFPLFFEDGYAHGHFYLRDGSGIIPGTLIEDGFAFFFVPSEDTSKRILITKLGGGINAELIRGKESSWGLQTWGVRDEFLFESERNRDTGTAELTVTIPGSWRQFAEENVRSEKALGWDPIRGRFLSGKTYVLAPEMRMTRSELKLPSGDVYTKLVFGDFIPTENKLPVSVYADDRLVYHTNWGIFALNQFTNRHLVHKGRYVEDTHATEELNERLKISFTWQPKKKFRGSMTYTKPDIVEALTNPDRSKKHFTYYFRCISDLRRIK